MVVLILFCHPLHLHPEPRPEIVYASLGALLFTCVMTGLRPGWGLGRGLVSRHGHSVTPSSWQWTLSYCWGTSSRP